MSERNGDKARFQRERKRKVLHRTRIRDLRTRLEQDKTTKQEPKKDPAAGVPLPRTVIH
jgi:hypothetical protein